MTEAKLIETAREIVTGDLMIADLSNPDWQHSLALIFSGADEDREHTIGLVIVPLGPHMKGYWLNGTAPAVTWECRFVHVNDINRLGALIAAMNAALHPDRIPADNQERNSDD